jgi:hypothetical protein
VSSSQNQEILEALMSGQRLTALDALERHHCFRLAARIHDLRKAGHDIEEETICHNAKRYSRYFIRNCVFAQQELCLA